MPLSLTEIAGNRASHTFPYATGTLTVLYLPALITDQTFAMLIGFKALAEDSVLEQFHSLNETLASIVVDWDVYEDDKQTQKAPTTVERFARLPIPFKIRLITELMGAANVGEASEPSPSAPSVAITSTVIDSGLIRSAAAYPIGTNF